MNASAKLPVILLVFSNESRKKPDGSNNERYLEGLQGERKAIERAIEEANKKLEAPVCQLEILEGKEANIQEVYDKFNEYKGRIAAFHFAGHADGYQLLLQSAEENKTEVANAGGLVAFFRQQSNLKLVFLNGCETHQQAKEIYDQGIPAVIGTNSPIGDELAKAFSHRFYRSLAQGVSLEHAWNDAISILQTQPGVKIAERKRGIDISSDSPGQGEPLYWDLHTQSFDWNLGSEAHNPLFGLPEPLQAPLEELPEDPFRYLERYGRKDAEIFFGRGREIRQLFSLLTSRQDSPLILFYGQSGAGKSSVLEAGLFPRLEARSPYLGNEVIYSRRDQEKGLLGSLKAELAKSLEPHSAEAVEQMEDWPVRQLVERHLSSGKAPRKEDKPSQNPFFQAPRLVLLLDQAEEAFTRPMAAAGASIQQEWFQLLEELSPLILNQRYSAGVKIILSYRKEYHPEIRAYCQGFGLSWEEIFLRPLDEQGIREVVMGIQSTERLREKYRVTVQEFDAEGQSLSASVAEDLLEDRYSAIAPILQIQLSELWDLEKPKAEGRAFTYDKYKKIKREGEGKLEKFFLEQLQKLWEERSPLTPYVHAGLAMDLLRFHTTEMGTAAQHRPRNLFDNYIGNEDGRISEEVLQAMADKLVDLRLLLKVDGGATRLAHDTLAPYVRKAFAYSDLPGQRAARILESKINQPAGGMLLAAVPQEPIPPPETDRLAFARRLDALREKIEALAAARADDSDPRLLEPANLRIVEEGKIGMRRWNEQERALVEYNQNVQNKVVRKKQGNRLVMVGLGLVMAMMIFWGLRNLAAMWEREDMLIAYQYLAQADEEMEQGHRENALHLASQAYLYNFPNDVSPILKRLVVESADSSDNPGALEWIGAVPEPLEQEALSPDGRFAVSWGGTAAKLAPMDLETEPLQILVSGEDSVSTAAFSPDSKYLGLALNSEEGHGIVLVWSLKAEGIPLITRDTFTHLISCMDFAAGSPKIALGTTDSVALAWDFQQKKLEGPLVHEGKAGIKQVAFSPDGKALVTDLGSLDEYLWRSDNGWAKAPLFLSEDFQDFSPDGSLFVTSTKGAAFLYEFSDDSWAKIGSIKLPGRDIAACRFTAGGEVIVQAYGNRAWVFDQYGTPKDIFDFNDTLQFIQLGQDGRSLYFLTRQGMAYSAPEGKSPPRLMEENRLSSGGHDNASFAASFPEEEKLTFSEELSFWHYGLNKLFWWAKFLLVLAFANFLAHFILSFSVWKGLVDGFNARFHFLKLGFWKTIGTIGGVYLLYLIFSFEFGGTDEWDTLANLAVFGALALAFNLIQLRRTYQRAQYLAFYGWLAFFLAWTVLIGRFAFEMDKYELFTMDDFEFAGIWSFIVIFAPIPFIFVVHLLTRLWGGVRQVARG